MSRYHDGTSVKPGFGSFGGGLYVADWSFPFGIELRHVVIAVALLICWKPANFFIKLMLKHYSVNMPEDKESGFNAGALIGTIERCPPLSRP